MSGKKLVSRLAVSTALCTVLPTISLSANLDIKQESYLYQMPLTDNIYTETFVLSAIEKSGIQKKHASESTFATPDLVAHFTNPITVYFQINSLQIDPSECSKMLSALGKLEVPQRAPLVVTGFTCQKGPGEFNVWLSNERAKAVAKLLEKEGYTVAKIEGKGDSNLVSKNYLPFNRRVEITALKK